MIHTVHEQLFQIIFILYFLGEIGRWTGQREAMLIHLNRLLVIHSEKVWEQNTFNCDKTPVYLHFHTFKEFTDEGDTFQVGDVGFIFGRKGTSEAGKYQKTHF